MATPCLEFQTTIRIMKVGDLVKHRGRDGVGVVFDIDGMRYDLPVVRVLWATDRGCRYEPVNELEIVSESR